MGRCSQGRKVCMLTSTVHKAVPIDREYMIVTNPFYFLKIYQYSGENTRQSDPALLKKALKRKAKKKAKSQEAWRTRMEQTRDKMDERQSIRNHNMKQRALGGAAGANLSRKRIKDAEGDDDVEGSTRIGGDKKKRPRLGPYAGKGRAGFEGKKQDFIKNKGNGKTDIKSQF